MREFFAVNLGLFFPILAVKRVDLFGLQILEEFGPDYEVFPFASRATWVTHAIYFHKANLA